MQNTISSSRFVLQSDWDVSVANRSETFWAGLKQLGKDGIYCNFLPASLDAYSAESESDSSEVMEIQSSDPKFAAAYHESKHSLYVYDPTTQYNTTFFAPSLTDSRIHKKSIYFVDVSPGGLGVSSDSVGNLAVWETQALLKRRELVGHCGDIYSCKFFPSGLVVMSGGADMQLKIWSVETGECARTLTGHQQAITDLGFVDRGRNVLSSSKDGTCRLWDCGSGTCLAKFCLEGAGQMNAIALAAGAGSSNSAKKGEQEVGTENKVLAVACENGSIAGFGLGDKNKIFEIRCDSSANTCTFVDSTKLICGSEKGFLYALDLRKPSSFMHVIKDGRGAVWSLCHVGKGYWVSFGDGSVCYRTLDPAQNGSFAEKELSGSDCDPVYRVCSDGHYLYTCCRDSKIRKYDLE